MTLRIGTPPYMLLSIRVGCLEATFTWSRLDSVLVSIPSGLNIVLV